MSFTPGECVTKVIYNHWSLAIPDKWIELIGNKETIDYKKLDSDSRISFATYCSAEGQFSLSEIEAATKDEISKFYTRAKRENSGLTWSQVSVARSEDGLAGC